LRQSNPLIPEPLALILEKCLAIEPKDRYQTGEAFAEDLQRFLNDEPILAHPDTLLLRFQRWCRHHPAVACLTGLLLTTVVGLIAMQRVVVRERDRYQLALADSLVAQTRFQRLTGRTGQRLQGLANLSRATTLNNQGEYATEALRAMVLPDLERESRWTGSHESFAVDSVALAPDFSSYLAFQSGRAEILAVPEPSAASRTLETMALPAGRPVLAKFSPSGRWVLVSLEVEPHQHRLLVFDSGTVHERSQHADAQSAVVEVDAAVNFAADIDANDRVLIAGVAVDGGWELQSLDLQTKQIGSRIPLPGAPFHVRCEKEGRRAAVSMPHANRVWVVDIFTGQVLHELEYGEDIYAVAWHPAGNHLAVGLGFDIELVELSPSLRSTQVLKGHTWMVHQLYFDASGAFLASHSLREGTSRIWDLRKRRQVLEVEGHVRGFQQSTVLGDIGTKPRLALVDATQISIHTLWTDQEYQVFGAADGRSSNCWRTVSHPHHALLISAGSDGLLVWHRESGALLARSPGASVYTLSIDRDTGEVLTAGPSGVQSWSIEWDESRKACTVSPPRVAQSQFADWNAASPAFAYHSSADGETRLVALQSPPRLLLLDSEHRLRRELETTAKVPYAALSPDGRWVASGNDEQAGLTVWNRDETSKGQRLDADGVSAQVFFSPDSQRLLACSNDRFTMFETGTWKKCWERTTSRVVEGTAAFSSDSRHVALSMGLGDVRLVNAETGEEVLTLDCSQDQVNILNLEFLFEPWRLCLSCGPAGLRVWNLRRAGEWMQEHRIAWPLP
jgi:WD40 repeat protein